ncbi:putative hydroxymethylpyrimidine transport system substrate-binding protein [Cereibacter ovatus]|uniref:Putative hydroxymethylpyrimidine transport system substrate-binding protein n=1 Tax=Cereibacter ovatus TaxID=439529 RepID=A0A285CMQ3_9RHOB|nr:ABC transporter substrate-binding protein [Cereibacter ovatus]SNX68840.1 putative hydroxymethylpyrimidine transport system substrate-binding protein [Cereibacter ovatus]
MKRLALLALLLPGPAAAEPLRLVLDWFVNPDHGPIIVAQQMGWFAEAGLTVEIIPPADPADPPKLVAAGAADLAITYQPQLYLQHAEGLPLVRVGTLVENPLYCVMAKADGPVQALSDLKGRKVGFSVAGIEEALLHTMLRTNGVQPSEVEFVNVNFALTPALAAGQVDAVAGAFRNFEPHQIAATGSEGRCFLPEENGVPAYDELIYVANPQRMNRDTVATFLAVTERAAAHIAAHPAESWQTFRGWSPEVDDTLNAAAWGDTLPHFAAHPAALDPARYDAFGRYMQQVGLIPAAPAVAEIAVDLTR